MTDLTDTDTEAPGTGPSGLNRRRFLTGVGMAGAAAVVLVACGDDEEPESGSSTTAGDGTTTTAGEDETTTTAGGGGAEADAEIAMLAASLEVLAVSTYQSAADAATGGALGEVPPAVVEFVTTALGQHQEALDAWNGVITGAGGDEVTDPPADLAATVEDAFGQVTDVAGAAELALMLEQIAADTYLDAISKLSDGEAIELAGSIAVVARQHQSILYYVLGQYPVPEVFATVEQSAA